jgi:hypothetical protein
MCAVFGQAQAPTRHLFALSLIRIKAAACTPARLPLQWGFAMTIQEIAIVSGIVLMFAVFALTVAWTERQTRRKTS